MPAKTSKSTTPQLPGWPAAMGDVMTGAYVGLSRAMVWKLASANKFPRPIVIDGARLARWRREDLDAWLSEQEPNRN